VQAAVGDWRAVAAPTWAAESISIRGDGSVSVRAYQTTLTGTVVPDSSSTGMLRLRLDPAPLGGCCIGTFEGRVITQSRSDGSRRLVAWAIAYDAVGEGYPLYFAGFGP